MQIHVRSIFISLLVTASLSLVLPLHAHAANKETGLPTVEAPHVKDATVNLYCRIKSGKKTYSSSGSGVFISERGVILTNAHVAQYFLLAEEDGRVKGECDVRTGSPARDRYDASLLYISPDWLKSNVENISKNKPRGTGENDFALLYVTKASKGDLPAAFPALALHTGIPAENSAVLIAGYPTEKLDFKGVQRKLQHVAASSTVTNLQSYGVTNFVDLITLAPSAAGSFGVSGGPVVNAANEVTGIVATKGGNEKDRTLRAISLSYIDRTLALSGLSLQTLTGPSSNFEIRAQLTEMSLPENVRETLKKNLLKKR
jgi:hypothetical protein